MSRIGKQLVSLPNGVTAEITGSTVTIKGPKGELKKSFHPGMKITLEDNKIKVQRDNNSKESRALHGLTRNLIVNMAEGVSKGYEKRLEIVGVGYRATAAKNKITLSLGFSHPVEYIAPTDIEFKMDEENKNLIIITSIDKQTLGEVAAIVRSFRKPEPYKGKGIKYLNEQIARKAGKAAAAAGAGTGAK